MSELQAKPIGWRWKQKDRTDADAWAITPRRPLHLEQNGHFDVEPLYSEADVRTLLDELDAKDRAIEALLRCPEIADCDPADKDPETIEAERLARSTLSLLKASRPQNREETDAENERIS